MTITFKTGNILDATENLICHQVNYQRKMSAGLAKQIRNKWPIVYSEYIQFIKENSWNEIVSNFGKLNFVKISSSPFQSIVNIFGQYNYERDKCYTDYLALKNQLKLLGNYSTVFNYSISLPHKISCGLSGGNWDDIVYPMIQKIFENSEVKVVIYKLEE